MICPECGSGCTTTHRTATWCGNCSWIEDPDHLMPQSRVFDLILDERET